MSKENLGPALARAVFPGVQGGPHENLIAAKAVAFREALLPSFGVYAKQVVANAQTLAANLSSQGLRVVSGGTNNHLMLLDVFGSFGITGKEAEKALEEVGISTNKNMIPFDPRKPMDPSGIRIGTPAITTRGMGASEMKVLGNIIIRTLKNREDASELGKIKQEVKNLCVKFPLYTK